MIINLKCSNSIKKRLEKLVQLLESGTNSITPGIKKEVDQLLEALFKNEYGEELYPREFVESELGMLLFKVKIGASNNYGKSLYSVKDIGLMRSVGNEAIRIYIRNQELKTQISDGKYYVERREVLKHLASREKVSNDIAEKVIQCFDKCKSSDLTDQETQEKCYKILNELV